MKSASLFVLVLVLQAAASVTGDAVTNHYGSVTSYNPADLLTKIFNPNRTIESRQRGYGLITFEDQPDPGSDDSQNPGQNGYLGHRPVKFEDNSGHNYNTDQNQLGGAVRFQDVEDGLSYSDGGVIFQDDNNVEDQANKKKRKRRRRRKPKNGVLPNPGTAGNPVSRPGVDGRPSYQGPYQAGYGLDPYGNQGYPARPYRRPRRPRRPPTPSLASEALSSITEALTSIARYDDYQCVPRLMCEAAGGGALTTNGVLQSIAGIQPLLTLLSAYNGISTSPLFVFGRAVFLGMTSQGNTGTCRYAYPQCPTDPEQLIYYLNNHNGGFFRFFNAPQLPNQNLEQFYNQLGNQGYGIYQPQPNAVHQNYGYPIDSNAGLYTNNQNQFTNPSAYSDQYYGPQTPGAYERPSLYNQNYSPSYANNYNNYGSGNQIRFKDSNKIEKRIQNKPTQNLADDDFEGEVDNFKSKWQFPDESSIITDVNENYYNVRNSRILKFPDEDQSYNKQKDSTRKEKQIYFPDKYNQNHQDHRQHVFSDSNRYQTSSYSYNNGQKQTNNQNQYNNRPNTYTNNYEPDNNKKYHNYDHNLSYNKYQNQQNYYNDRQNIYNNNHKYQQNTIFNNEEYVFDHKHNFYVKKENNYPNNYNKNKYNTNDYSDKYGSNKYSNDYNTNSFNRNENNGIKTVYVVRGNGDPNRPEIVKLRPGQSVH